MSSAAPAVVPAATSLGDNRGIRFNIKTGTAKWSCTLQDRSTYDRTKAAREASTPTDSETSSTTSKSA